MGIKRFEDIIAWEKAQNLALQLYKLFRKHPDYAYTNQITKAAVSISNNIAEGFERQSYRDFSRFVSFALASNSEVRSMLYLAPKLGYLDKEVSDNLISLTNDISRLLYGLKKSLKSQS
ncbi:MAG: four helix bundle protein [Bacteroidia bacterium]|nr:four helix bundle protein [Bacteroidia bacterium]